MPFALGAALGGIATDRVPVGNAAGHMWSSWLNATSLLIGILAVATSAYMAAVYLAADAAHDHQDALECSFRVRALGSGTVAGALALASILVLDDERHRLFHSLLTGRALPAVIVSGVAGIATLWLVYRRHYEPARYSASVAVAAITAGWALARWPTILPHLTLDQAAAGHDTLVCVVVAVLAGGIVLAPALVLLFGLTLGGRLRAAEGIPLPGSAAGRPPMNVRRTGRLSAACLIAGFGLLNLANAAWAHALGVVCLFGFAGLGFYTIADPALGERSGLR